MVSCCRGAQRNCARGVERLGAPLTIKLSVNHHLMDEDAGLIALAGLLRDTLAELGGERLLVINVRLRKGCDDDDARVRAAVESAGLAPHANFFFLQRYGFASNETEWNPPKPVWDAFTLVNPDGTIFGPDLIARSEGMRMLPREFVEEWRRLPSAAFDLHASSTAGRDGRSDAVETRPVRVYANANLSVYSAQAPETRNVRSALKNCVPRRAESSSLGKNKSSSTTAPISKNSTPSSRS